MVVRPVCTDATSAQPSQRGERRVTEVVACTDTHERDCGRQPSQALCTHAITTAMVRHLEDVDRARQQSGLRQTGVDRLLGITGQQR